MKLKDKVGELNCCRAPWNSNIILYLKHIKCYKSPH